MVEHLFNRLYVDYHQSLYQFLVYLLRDKDTAEELVQDVYIRVMHAYDKFKGDSSEKTWLFSIARNVAIDYIRKQKRQKKTLLSSINLDDHKNQWIHPDRLPDEILEQNEAVRQLYAALEQCKAEHRELILLRYIHGFSIRESASIMGWTEGKVKTVQHRTLKTLKGILDDTKKEEELSNGTI
ncbi:sigma-70 family RNA polymerase sigma factor [Alkalihalobacillus berkeleyi]|uniref:RNA polymerase sigma factor n=1 Tax=Pseudalkalibacillus berkeleyi TaxID=1069813 RepID=A0ABS9H603_9BACL|nr:sigma-70 family RNA polymerase sigma factor [Pseudalkalibacillus berkeleyi]